MSDLILNCEALNKSYRDGDVSVDVIQNLSLSVYAGESLSIVGSSGSGKSTLLHLLGGLDAPTSGKISLKGQDYAKMNQKKLGDLRNQYLGFVYQFHHLLLEFSALENVMIPLLIGKKSRPEAEAMALAILTQVGLKDRIKHRPSELSGGERQRAAIARALVTRPACILADEPTGNLDRKNAQNVLSLMLELKQEYQTSLVVVTHDDELAMRFDRVFAMQEGHLVAAEG